MKIPEQSSQAVERKLSGISAFFPAYNDGGTIASMVVTTLMTLREVAEDYEVIVVNDGSGDYTRELLNELEGIHAPRVRVIHHPQNRGYGAALRTGFAAARLDWVFYTDGDAQYDPRELRQLVGKCVALGEQVEVVNGYKISRNDPWYRLIIGRMYHHFVRTMFGFKLRDVDCDFRLIRRSVFDTVPLRSDSGTICLELVKKCQDAGFRFAEVPVHHYHRAFGQSQFFNFRRVWRTLIQLFGLWHDLVWRGGRQGQATVPVAALSAGKSEAVSHREAAR